MILVDANLLIYAHVASFPQHPSARNWLDARLSGSTPVGLPWPSLLAFLRIVTNPRVSLYFVSFMTQPHYQTVGRSSGNF